MIGESHKSLQDQITKIQERELAGEIGSMHLKDVIVSELEKQDFEMWKRVQNNPDGINREEFTSYLNNVKKEGNPSQIDFSGYLANKITPLWLKEDFRNREAA